MILIRPAKKSDFKPWAQMRAELWPEGTAQDHQADLKDFSRNKQFRGWLAIEHGKTVGFDRGLSLMMRFNRFCKNNHPARV